MTVARSAPSHALERWLPKQSVQTPGWAYVAIRTLAKSDPRAAIKFLPRLQGWGEATRFTGDIARIWFANNPSEATEWVNGLDNGLASFARRVILESLHEQPEIAAEWFANLEASEQDSQVVDALHQIVGRRARSNAIAAYEWAMQVVPAEHQQETLREAIIPNLPADQLDAFLDQFESAEIHDALALELGEDRSVSELITLVESIAKRTNLDESLKGLAMPLHKTIAEWSSQEPQSLAEWAWDWNGSARVRALALSQSLSANREHINLEGAFAVYKQIEDAQFQLQSAKTLGAVWALTDPEGGLAWAQTQEDESIQASVIEGIIATWMREQPDKASLHLDSMPAGIPKDTALVALIDIRYRVNPAICFEWARSLNDPDTFRHSMRKVVHLWAMNEEQAAINAIVNSEMDAETTEQLLAVARKAGRRRNE